MGLDPNTVAMYLDNTLSAERVPDFEKVCLESDVHLAEVAACHQVLALVLGEPAEVNPALRRRLYGLAQNAAPAESEPPKRPPPLPPEVKRRYRPRVPDYLREDRRSRIWTIAATVVIAIAIGAGVIRALGPYDRNNPALAWLPIWPDEQVAVNENGPAKQKQSKNTGDDQDNVAPPPSNTTEPPPKVTTDATASANAKIESSTDTTTNSISTDIPKTAIPQQEPIVPHSVEPPPTVDQGAAKTVSDDDAPPLVKDDVDRGPADAAADKGELLPVDNAPARVAAEPLGRFLTDPNVLLKPNRNDVWERIAQGATLYAGDRLLVLPTYRPNITLGAGLTIDVLGETLIELVPPDENRVAGLRIPYGRVVLLTAGNPDVSLNVWLGDRKLTARFVDADSTLAAEVRRFLPAGADPEQEPAYVAIDLYVPPESGDVDLSMSENPQPRRVSGPAHVALGTPYPFGAADEGDQPTWIRASALSGLDQLASDPMNAALRQGAERPVALTLREKLDDRRPEMVYLAARSLALIDEFDPLIAALNQDDQKAAWTRLIESLQSALARGPDTAARVREAFEKQRGDEGKDLYRMLRGYSKADIMDHAAVDLVEHLDHTSLDMRVLAFHALRSVPGVTAHFNYRPEGILAERRKAVGRWREFIKMDTSPLSAKGAQDRPGPAAKSPASPPATEDTQ
jgi:hypothetical protein